MPPRWLGAVWACAWECPLLQAHQRRFASNGIIVKASRLRAVALQVSEHASWSARYYKRIIDAALAAAGAPADLVQVCVCVCMCGMRWIRPCVPLHPHLWASTCRPSCCHIAGRGLSAAQAAEPLNPPLRCRRL